MDCDFCGDPSIEVDCLGNKCCVECWELQKDWTLEKQAALDKLSEEVCAMLRIEIPQIKVENGLSPDADATVCTRCRKIVKSDDGLWFCDCLDERKGIDPTDPSVVLLPERFLK